MGEGAGAGGGVGTYTRRCTRVNDEFVVPFARIVDDERRAGRQRQSKINRRRTLATTRARPVAGGRGRSSFA